MDTSRIQAVMDAQHIKKVQAAGTLNVLTEVVREASHLAVLMVDQIEWIDIEGSTSEDFSRDCTAYMKQQKQRDSLKCVVEATAARILNSPMVLAQVNPESVCCAADLVTKAVRAMLIVSGNRWIKDRRLVIKFESIEAPWEQDETSRAQEMLLPPGRN